MYLSFFVLKSRYPCKILKQVNIDLREKGKDMGLFFFSIILMVKMATLSSMLNLGKSHLLKFKQFFFVD